MSLYLSGEIRNHARNGDLYPLKIKFLASVVLRSIVGPV